MNPEKALGIETFHLEKRYGQNHAVVDLNLNIFKGELFAFLGPNGAGKTTTLKMLAGLIKPTSGRIRIDGVDLIENSLEVKKRLGYIPDQPMLYEKLTVDEFIIFVGSVYGMGRDAIEQGAQELLKRFDLVSCRDQLIGSLSHGMRQRVVFCSTLIHAPKVLLIDEPMVGLDPINVKRVKDTLRDIKSQGCTIFFSTHSLTDAEDLADRIGILSKGRLIATGNPQELKKKGKDAADLEEAFLTLTE